jgi:hypothetical protein
MTLAAFPQGSLNIRLIGGPAIHLHETMATVKDMTLILILMEININVQKVITRVVIHTN